MSARIRQELARVGREPVGVTIRDDEPVDVRHPATHRFDDRVVGREREAIGARDQQQPRVDDVCDGSQRIEPRPTVDHDNIVVAIQLGDPRQRVAASLIVRRRLGASARPACDDRDPIVDRA